MGSGIRGMLWTAVFALALQPAQFAAAQPGPWTNAQPSPFVKTQLPFRVIYPGQRTIEYRDPAAFPYVPLPPTAEPPTVSNPPTGTSCPVTRSRRV